tara:strand:- start:1016 stop:1351 length:336 start_codon:yes stop_codon:yes gene_type:complete
VSDIFKYDTEIPYEANYSTWKLMNDREYMEAGSKPYSKQESRRVFNENHGNYSLNFSEAGEIHKRLVRNRCPKCKSTLKTLSKTKKALVRQCNTCHLTISDPRPGGEFPNE